jgi:hypothetical protein
MEELILADMLRTLAADFCDDGKFVVLPRCDMDTNHGTLSADLFLGAIIADHLVSAVVRLDCCEDDAGLSELDLGLKRRGIEIFSFRHDDILNHTQSCALEVLLTLKAAAESEV